MRLCEPVRLRGEGRLSHSRALAINFSSTGLFVAADEPADVGERVRCELSFLPRSPIDVACRVVWVRNQSDREGPTGMGLAFEDLTSTRAERIDRALSRLQRGSSSTFMAVDPFAESGTWAPEELFEDDALAHPASRREEPRSLKLALALSMAVIAGLLVTIALLLTR